MKEIRRTLGGLKNLVIDAEQKDEGTSYLVPIELNDVEVSKITRDAISEVMVAVAKRMAMESDLAADFDSDDWDDFTDRVSDTFIDVVNYGHITDGQKFLYDLERCVEAVLDDMQNRFFEVSVTVTSTVEVVVPVKARSEREAREWVENMPYSDIGGYAEDKPEISDVDITDIERSDSGYGNYEDAT